MPRPISPPTSTAADQTPATFSLKATLWRTAFSPFVGLGSGMLGGVATGLFFLWISLPGTFAERSFGAILGAPYIGLLSGFTSSPYAVVTGFVVIPLLPFLRRGRILDAAVVAILAGSAAYFVAKTGDQPFPGTPAIQFLSIRIAAAVVAAGTCLYLLGRGDDRRFAAAITSATTFPRRRSAADWRNADRG